MIFVLITSWDEVLRTLAMLSEKGSIRGVARATGHDQIFPHRRYSIIGVVIYMISAATIMMTG